MKRARIEKMERALSFLQDSLGSRRFLAQFWVLKVKEFKVKGFEVMLTNLGYPYLYLIVEFPNGLHMYFITCTFDLETEKVFQALQAANLWSNAAPRLRPEFFSRDHRAELAEIADVIRAVCQTHGLRLALTWIPCDHTWEGVNEISKLRVMLGDSRLNGKCILCIERTACYADEEMQGFVQACEQRFMHEGQGVAGKTLKLNQPYFKSDVKTYNIAKYPLVHHARKYNLNVVVAIGLRSIDAGYNYILEFFLPFLMKEHSEQQDLVRNLKVTLHGICKSLRMVSEAELVGNKVLKFCLRKDMYKASHQ